MKVTEGIAIVLAAMMLLAIASAEAQTLTSQRIGGPPIRLSMTNGFTTTIQSGEHNFFDEDEFGSGWSVDHHITPTNITYTQSDGRFTFEKNGIVEVDLSVQINTLTPGRHWLMVRLNGVNVYRNDVYVPENPAPASLSLLLDVVAGDYLEFLIEPRDVLQVSASNGTTVSIHKIN